MANGPDILYAWNEEQTDATLVEAGGDNRAFIVGQDAASNRKQTWHIPSRDKYMVSTAGPPTGCSA